MSKKSTYEELEQRVKELEKEALEHKRLEEELRENSTRYRTLLETADDAIAFKDSEGLYVEVNKEFLRRLGPSNEEIIGKTAQDVYPKEVGAKIFENDLEVLKTGRLREFEDRYPTPKGTTIVSLARKVPIRDESGRVVGLLAIARDITARKRAEEKLGKAHDELERRVEERTAALTAANEQLKREIEEHKRSEEEASYERDLMQTLLNNIPDYIYFKDKNRRFVRASNSFCDLLGCSMEDIIGKKDEDLFPEEVAKETVSDDRHVIETGTPLVNKEEFGESIGGEDHWVLTTKLPWRDKDDNIIGLFGISKEITDRKKVEKALSQSEERYRSVVEDSIHGIIIFKQGFTIQFVNQAAVKMFGFDKPDELIGLNSMERLVAPEYHNEIKGRVADLEDGKLIPTHLGWQGIRKDGTRIWVQSTGTQHLWQGRPAVLAYLLDITDYKKAEEEKKRLEAQLQQAQRMESIGTLAGGLAHNFNNLLMSIIGNTSIMLLDIDPNHPHYKNLKNIEKNVISGSKVTKQLLGYAREGKYEVKPINLNRLVKETSDTFGMTRKEIRVHQELLTSYLG